MEALYKCGCHGSSESCDLHSAALLLESSDHDFSKTYRRGKNSVILNKKPRLDFKPELLAFDHVGQTIPDYKAYKKYIAKANYIIVLTDAPDDVIHEIDLDYIHVPALVMWGTFEPEVKHLTQLLFYKKPVEGKNQFAYICSSALLEISWLKLLKPKSVGVFNARNMNWHVAAHKLKLPYTIQTKYRLLAKRITSNKFCTLNQPSTIYDFREQCESGEIG